MEVDAVDETKTADILTLDAEQVTGVELTVTRSEGAAETGVVQLDESLDAGIFDHIQVVLGDPVVLGIDSVASRFKRGGSFRRVQGVAHFVTDEHIVGIAFHIPQGQGQAAFFDIEGGGLGGGIDFDSDVFSRHQAG